MKIGIDLGGSHIGIGIIEGVELKEVLSEFMNDLANADEIIGHNVDFDFHIVGCELYRTGGAYDELMNRQYICTMQASTDFCAIPSNSPYGGYKWPKLEELYRKLFGRMFDNAHDALADVETKLQYQFNAFTNAVKNEDAELVASMSVELLDLIDARNKK